MLACVALCLVFGWPHHHKKPAPEPDLSGAVLIDDVNKEIIDDIGELKDIHDNYPWLKSWAMPAIDAINRIEGPSDDKTFDDDLQDLRLAMWRLRILETNDTI